MTQEVTLHPLAACGLIVIMIEAVVLTLASAGISGAVVPLVSGSLSSLHRLWPPFLSRKSLNTGTGEHIQQSTIPGQYVARGLFTRDLT
jgi:hypothetical protein